MDTPRQVDVAARYKVSAGARRAFNCVLIEQMVWQPVLTSYERGRLAALRQENERIDDGDDRGSSGV